MRNNFEVKGIKKAAGKVAVLSMAALAVAGSLLLSKPAAATPSTLGFYPSTDIYGAGVFHFDFDSYGKGLNADAAVTSGLTYGFGDSDKIFGRSEIGFDYIFSLGGVAPSNSGMNNSKRLLFNAKTQLYNNSESTVRVVAGVWGLGNKEVFAPNVGYVSASKSFDFGRVTLGVARSFQKEAVVADLNGESDRTNLHLGYDKMLTDKLQFAVDYYSGKSAYSGVQPTLYYYLNDKSNIGIGYFRTNSKAISPSRNQVYVCFDYNFGGSTAPVNTAAPAPEAAAPSTGATATN